MLQERRLIVIQGLLHDRIARKLLKAMANEAGFPCAAGNAAQRITALEQFAFGET